MFYKAIQILKVARFFMEHSVCELHYY